LIAFVRRHLRTLLVVALLVSAPALLHLGVGCVARLAPPAITLPAGEVESAGPGLRRFGKSWALEHQKLLVVRLEGTPEAIGYAHARLLYDDMVKNEGILLGRFREQVPAWPARIALLDLAQLRYRAVDRKMSDARLREIAAGARGFQPDPYSNVFETYQRFVYLNALYDIALSFEHSPLIGCTSLVFRPEATEKRHALLARAFDFEVDDVFGERKAVFLVLEQDRIPFASVAWPGLVGVVSGLNVEGVGVVVHGGRAGEPSTQGEPVVHALRRVLGTARTAREAAMALQEQEPMVSHIVVVVDARGDAVVVERVPGSVPYVRWLGAKEVVTNHFLGIASDDLKNQLVREKTSTIARYRRGEQLLGEIRRPASVADAVRVLRDRRGVNGVPLELGDRRAIDALIATHGVVMDATARTLWVSESPHLLGRFVAFDLRKLLAPGFDPKDGLGELQTIPEDPMLTSGEYARFESGRPKRSSSSRPQ
jgi:isopenicillin-N N-acyltransferase like protein